MELYAHVFMKKTKHINRGCIIEPRHRAKDTSHNADLWSQMVILTDLVTYG